jgi:hypothetical protein
LSIAARGCARRTHGYKANDLIADSHPTHFATIYMYGGGIKNGWLDKKQAKAAGL